MFSGLLLFPVSLDSTEHSVRTQLISGQVRSQVEEVRRSCVCICMYVCVRASAFSHL